MPNHVTNVVKINGSKDEINKILNEIKNDEIGVGSVTFEKIIPMPENIYTGMLGPEEMEKYGENNWYDWSCKNWGTKWDAYGFDDLDHLSSDNSFQFCTAWATPMPIFEKLGKMYPNVEFEIKYADEDMGNNCGKIIVKGNDIYTWTPSEDEALKFACEVVGYDYEDYLKELEEWG